MGTDRKLEYLTSLGMIAFPWLVLNVIIFAALQDSYSHINNYVSELGAIKANYSEFMNVFGFIGTGLLIILFGVGIFLTLRRLEQKNYVGIFVVAFGTMFCLIAIPMDYPGRYHFFFALYALVPFYLTVVFGLFVIYRLNVSTKLKYLLYFWGMMVFLDAIIPLSLPVGLYQRMTLTLVFGWFCLFSLIIFMASKAPYQKLERKNCSNAHV
ncbi:MAG: DUF998 domain-containing protein [Cellvibrionaceae bacterium]